MNETQDFQGLFSSGASGILGLSFTSFDFSVITHFIAVAFGNNTGLDRSPTTNIFSQNPSAPTSFDIQLQRTEDLEAGNKISSAGVFLIAEHLDGFEAIEDQPKLFKQNSSFSQHPKQTSLRLNSSSANADDVMLGTV